MISAFLRYGVPFRGGGGKILLFKKMKEVGLKLPNKKLFSGPPDYPVKRKINLEKTKTLTTKTSGRNHMK